MLSREAGRYLKNYNVNKVIKILILSDFIIWSGSQLFAPIIAIFIADNLVGGSIESAGIAVAVGLLVKAVLEMPVGMYIDKSPSERDDLYSIILGSFIMGATILMYSFITDVWQMYILQALMGAGAAISYPGWSSMFTKHIDKSREAFEWSLYDVFLGNRYGRSCCNRWIRRKSIRFQHDILHSICSNFPWINNALHAQKRDKVDLLPLKKPCATLFAL